VKNFWQKSMKETGRRHFPGNGENGFFVKTGADAFQEVTLGDCLLG
jgi:hypothetical protein